MMRQWEQGEGVSAQMLVPHLDQCLGCRACESACPSGVQYGHILAEVRTRLVDQQPTWKRWIRRLAFRHALPNRSFLNACARLYEPIRKTGVFNLIRALPGIRHWSFTRQNLALLPSIGEYRPLRPSMQFGDPTNPRAALMTGCIMDTVYNPIHWDTIDVLVANGYCVTIPEQTCCGALAEHAGERDIAADLAKKNIQTILQAQPEVIVLNSAGCGAFIKEYGDLLADDPMLAQAAQDFSGKVKDIMEVLALKALAPMPNPIAVKATYHPACHLHHAQKVQHEPLHVLSQVPGLTLAPLPDATLCCGSAGVYNVEHPELAAEILDQKIANIAKTGASVVLTGNPGCLLQIEKGLRDARLPVKIQHPIELIAQAYRGPRPATRLLNLLILWS
jgi:glycolate oxidase iron-sulfur subunit